MFWYGDGGWAFWQVALMWVGMAVFWGVLIWGLYTVLTGANRRTSDQPRNECGSAGQILDERLARGEIDADEYRRLRHVIGTTRDDNTARTESNR